jgi:Lysylphosphatidylglycerol synthase TM region
LKRRLVRLTKKTALKIIPVLSLAAGLALFAYLIRQTGVGVIAGYLSELGWGFALIVALSEARNCLRAASWYFSIEPRHRHLRFWPLHNVMLAGEAIKFLTATGPFLGEPAKAAMVRGEVPLVHGFSSVVVENLIYNVTVFVLMLAGLPALALLEGVPGRLKLIGYIFAGGIIMFMAVTWLAVRGRWYVLARLLEVVSRITDRREEGGRVLRVAARVREVESNVSSFYEQRRGTFYLIFGINILAHVINVAEVYLILALMNLPASLWGGFVVEAVTKIINLVFFFVPTRAGVYESGHAVILGALGMSAAAGVTLAIIRKLRAFVWIGYGLAMIGLLTLNSKSR